MTDREFSLTSGGQPPLASGSSKETAFLHHWDDDIRRAARAAANGNDADEEDLAQVVRMRLLIVNRAFQDAPAAYIRAVITNTLRSVLRYEARRFSTRSPLAEQLNPDFPAPVDDLADAKVRSVAAWVNSLPVRFQAVYRQLYSEGRSQRDAARLMSVSQPRISQLHRQLLEQGRQDLADVAA